MDEDLIRKVRERYGYRSFSLLRQFAFPDNIEGGDGVCYVILFDGGKISAWLRASGLYYETDAAEIESYFAKIDPWPAEVIATLSELRGQLRLLNLPGVLPSPLQATVATVGARWSRAFATASIIAMITPKKKGRLTRKLISPLNHLAHVRPRSC